MFNKIIASVLASFMIVAGVGCLHKKSTSEPAQVQIERSLLAAADAVNVVATGLNAVDDARKNLQASNQISAESSQEILEYLKVVAAKNDAAVKVIALAESGNQQADWKAAVLDVVASAGQVDLNQFGVKNADSQAQLKAAFALLQSAIQGLTAQFGGK
jgi:hypothetical protein